MAEAAAARGFMTTNEARRFYDLQYVDSPDASPLDRELTESGIVKIRMPLTDGDFEELISQYEDCIDVCPQELGRTYYQLDERFGNEVGHQRKEQKVDPKTGLQVADPKNFMHFTEGAENHWRQQFRNAPSGLLRLIAIGTEIQHELIKVGEQTYQQLEATHPNITRAHFDPARNPRTRSFMRLLSYDGYVPTENMGDVAKPHYDIGNGTIQAYADAPGFWAAPDGYKGEATYHDTGDGEAFFFIGSSHRKVYGSKDPLKPLWHGVSRVIPENSSYVPRRHAVVIFIDMPRVDCAVTPNDTLPYLEQVPVQETSVQQLGTAATRLSQAS
ncbi:MAG TPA: hypothetical protein VK983_04485 [Candidatus Limnocylindrales bacterium]|nr:hypothetical protein [Candidatus Limnocylindrales bacterium]